MGSKSCSPALLSYPCNLASQPWRLWSIEKLQLLSWGNYCWFIFRPWNHFRPRIKTLFDLGFAGFNPDCFALSDMRRLWGIDTNLSQSQTLWSGRYTHSECASSCLRQGFAYCTVSPTICTSLRHTLVWGLGPTQSYDPCGYHYYCDRGPKRNVSPWLLVGYSIFWYRNLQR